MTLTRRLAWLCFLVLCFVVLLTAQGIESDVLKIFLKATVAGTWPDPTLNAFAAVCSRSLLLAAVLLPWWVWPRLRDFGRVRLTWTWTLLLTLPYAVLPGIYTIAWGFNFPPPTEAACLVGYGLLTGVIEEVVFRGYMFHDHPETHPRFVILVSSLLFGGMHIFNLTYAPPGFVHFQVPYTLVFGLGMGILRMVTGRLAWCILIHSAVDVFVFAFPATSTYYHILNAVIRMSALASVILLWRHPALRAATAPPVQPERLDGVAPAATSQIVKGAAVFLTNATAWPALVLSIGLSYAERDPTWMQKIFGKTHPAGHHAQAVCMIGASVLLPLGFICFYVTAAVRRLSRRAALAGWMASAVYHAMAAWLLAILHLEFRTGLLGVLPLWRVSIMALIVSLFVVAYQTYTGRRVSSGQPMENNA